MAWASAQEKLCLDCAFTGLAATQIYNQNFNTAHCLFEFL